MTLESDFLTSGEDAEMFVASIQRKHLSIKDIAKAIVKVVKKDDWGRVEDDIQEDQKPSLQEMEY